MNVLALTRYERLGASSRMRSYQYLPALQAAGLRVTVEPLFSEDYVRGLQQGRRSVADVAAAYARRMAAMARRGAFDLLWIEKELLPWLPAWVERLLLGGQVPYVLDYDDAVFHQYDQHPSAWVRRWLGRKHGQLMRRAALVVAGNDYIADHARAAGASAVVVLPTVINLVRYPVTEERSDAAGLPIVGWIGQRATAAFLQPLAPVFRQLAGDRLARFSAVGIDAAALGLPMGSEPWSEETEVSSIRRFDVGIMPLLDGPFERGKCGYKLIQYMACGLPVVASPVGVNRQIVEHGVNGFLAETPEQWATALRTLLADPALRQQMGRAGRQKVEKSYCLDVTAPRLVALLQTAAEQGKAHD